LSTYNGWPSYETWLTFTWLTRDEHSDSICRHLAQTTSSVEQTATAIKTYVEASCPLLNTPSLYADLLNRALGRVEWRALAIHFRQTL
jgi:hypothetical protein